MIARTTMTAWLFATVAGLAYAQADKPAGNPAAAQPAAAQPAAAQPAAAQPAAAQPAAAQPAAAQPAAAQPATAAVGPIVEIKTSEGVIKLELNEQAAPVTVKNFVTYVNDKHYDGTIFHRVIDGFMIQGGGYTAEGDRLSEKKTREPIINEAKNGLKNDRGTIAMARTADPNSATGQFFINLVNNDRLNFPNPDGHGYAVFGKVIEGIEVVEKIGKVKTAFKAGMADVPTNEVKILSVTVAGGKAH